MNDDILEELRAIYQGHPLLTANDPTITLEQLRRAIMEISALRHRLGLPTLPDQGDVI